MDVQIGASCRVRHASNPQCCIPVLSAGVLEIQVAGFEEPQILLRFQQALHGKGSRDVYADAAVVSIGGVCRKRRGCKAILDGKRVRGRVDSGCDVSCVQTPGSRPRLRLLHENFVVGIPHNAAKGNVPVDRSVVGGEFLVRNSAVIRKYDVARIGWWRRCGQGWRVGQELSSMCRRRRSRHPRAHRREE